ncbi:hypothetical protein [Rosenbergiella collisarenosi]|uniref:hypothetical protein n=1 Tax=Rosenbergiella collisarenosi TaxID=1544695 RepID=UPI001F4EF406|nr:hypothetical protein [Rosenbergiella collisarenosi]
MSDDKGLIGRITSTVSAASNPIKGVWDTAKELNSMNVDYSVKIKTEELLSRLVDARSASLDLSELLREAKDKIIELEALVNRKEDFDNDKINYEMYQPIPGTTVYKLKELNNLQQPLHYLCAKCYHLHVKSILQYKDSRGPFDILTCHMCSSDYMFEYFSGIRQTRGFIA